MGLEGRALLGPRPVLCTGTDPFVPIAQVVKRVGLSRIEIRKRSRAGTFPPAFKVTAKQYLFLEREVLEWEALLGGDGLKDELPVGGRSGE